MILVRIELWSARTGKVTELGVATISNCGGTVERGTYAVSLYRTLAKARSKAKPYRTATVTDFPRRSLGGFDLALRALAWAVGDRNKKELELVRKSHEEARHSSPSTLARGGS